MKQNVALENAGLCGQLGLLNAASKAETVYMELVSAHLVMDGYPVHPMHM
jgi:hypothetical protein